MEKFLKPNMVLEDINGAQYKIKEVFPEVNSFSYFFKDVGSSRWSFQGMKYTYILEVSIKAGNIKFPTKAGNILYGKSDKTET